MKITRVVKCTLKIWPWGCVFLYHMTNFEQNDWLEVITWYKKNWSRGRNFWGMITSLLISIVFLNACTLDSDSRCDPAKRARSLSSFSSYSFRSCSILSLRAWILLSASLLFPSCAARKFSRFCAVSAVATSKFSRSARIVSSSRRLSVHSVRT